MIRNVIRRAKMRHLSLFSGVGGIDLAAHWAGMETVAFCESGKYQRLVLHKHWPDVPIWKDVKNVTAIDLARAGIGRIDIVSGGFPCQPHSLAGKRLASGDERDLWGEFRRVIGETKPRWVVAENVPGLFSSESGRFFGGVLKDLAEMGFDAGWACYGAVDVGAPHRRDRVFIVAVHRSSLSHPDDEHAMWFEHGRDDVAQWEKPRIQQAGLRDRERKDRKRAIEPGLGGMVARLPRRMDENWMNCSEEKLTYDKTNRGKRLECLGNAVVPHQIYPVLRAIVSIPVVINYE